MRRAEVLVVAALAVLALVAALLVPTYPNYDTLLPPRVGARAHARHEARLRGLRRADRAPALPRRVRAGRARRHRRRAPDRADLRAVASSRWSGAASASARRASGCGRRWPAPPSSARASPSCSTPRAPTSTCPFLALVLWAAALEARAPRRGVPVMAVLAVAGLLRPEAWVLAGAYWLWCGWRRIDLLALAAAAPIGRGRWSTCGSPAIRSSRCTPPTTSPTSSIATAGCPRCRARSCRSSPTRPRPPVALAGARRRRLLWRLRPGRALHVPIALFGAGVVTFLATGLAGLSVLPRYLTIPVVAVCLVAGYGVLGFTTLPRGPRAPRCGRARRSAARRARARLRGDQGARRRHAARRAALHQGLARRPRGHPRRPGGAARPALRPADFPNYRLVPDSRWLLDLPARRVGARSRAARTGVAMFVSAPRSSSATASPPAPARRPTCPTPASSRSPATRAYAPT